MVECFSKKDNRKIGYPNENFLYSDDHDWNIELLKREDL